MQQKQPASLVGGRIFSASCLALPCTVPLLARDAVSRQPSSGCGSSDEVVELQRLIQSAIFGAVFAAEAVSTCEGGEGRPRRAQVAVKVLSLSLLLSAPPSSQEDFLSELTFYEYLRGHRNIITPNRVYVDLQQQLLVLLFPLAEFEDLFEVLKKREVPFHENEVSAAAAWLRAFFGRRVLMHLSSPACFVLQVRWIARQLLDAVLHLHRRGVAMRGERRGGLEEERKAAVCLLRRRRSQRDFLGCRLRACVSLRSESGKRADISVPQNGPHSSLSHGSRTSCRR